MPKKIRELKAMLKKAGFQYRPAKGGHSVWTHEKVTIAGNDGDDAKRYLENEVESAIHEVEQQP